MIDLSKLTEAELDALHVAIDFQRVTGIGAETPLVEVPVMNLGGPIAEDVPRAVWSQAIRDLVANGMRPRPHG